MTIVPSLSFIQTAGSKVGRGLAKGVPTNIPIPSTPTPKGWFCTLLPFFNPPQMDCCLDEDGKAALRVNKDIEREIERWRRDQSKEYKLLLLGERLNTVLGVRSQ